MPGISVIDSDGDIQEFADATTWHIDDRGQLHLKAGDKPVASFAKDRWQGAGTSESSVPAFNAQLAYTEELASINERLGNIAEMLASGPSATGDAIMRAIKGAQR